MPSRFVCLVILIYWVIAAFFLLTREVLPELSLGYPPDLRAIATAGKDDADVTWTIHVIDDPKHADVLRTIGEAVTRSTIRPDGTCGMKSRVSLDSEGLFKGTPFASVAVGRLQIDSRYEVDSKGNLQSLDLDVTSDEAPGFLFKVQGKLKGRSLEITFRSKDQVQTRLVPYEPKSVVSNMFGPLDRLPGLHVGQRWDARVVNPLSGQVDRVRVEVLKRTLVHWGSGPVSVFEVVQSLPPLTSARSWVRTDGVILRQEIPFPFVRLVLERRQQPGEVATSEVPTP